MVKGGRSIGGETYESVSSSIYSSTLLVEVTNPAGTRGAAARAMARVSIVWFSLLGQVSDVFKGQLFE